MDNHNCRRRFVMVDILLGQILIHPKIKIHLLKFSMKLIILFINIIKVEIIIIVFVSTIYERENSDYYCKKYKISNLLIMTDNIDKIILEKNERI